MDPSGPGWGLPAVGAVQVQVFRGDTQEVLVRTVSEHAIPRTGETIGLNGAVYRVEHLHWDLISSGGLHNGIRDRVSIRVLPV